MSLTPASGTFCYFSGVSVRARDVLQTLEITAFLEEFRAGPVSVIFDYEAAALTAELRRQRFCLLATILERFYNAFKARRAGPGTIRRRRVAVYKDARPVAQRQSSGLLGQRLKVRIFLHPRENEPQRQGDTMKHREILRVAQCLCVF